MEDLWQSVCSKHSISDSISEKWWREIKEQYSQNHRHFHNLALLESKLEFLKNSHCSIFFATVFHYLNYDNKVNMVQENCDAFKRFADEAKIDNVSSFKVIYLIVIIK